MVNQDRCDGQLTRSATEIEEVDVEVGFIIASCCCSLELEEDDDLEDTLGADESPHAVTAAEGNSDV